MAGPPPGRRIGAGSRLTATRSDARVSPGATSRASAYTPRAATASTVISPIVSKPRKSTRMTFTTLRPPPSANGSSMNSVEIDRVDPRRRRRAAMNANTKTPTAAETTMRLMRPDVRGPVARSGRAGGGARARRSPRRCVSTQHLGEREVGRALEDEHQGHAVADGAEAEHRRHAVLDHGGGDRRRRSSAPAAAQSPGPDTSGGSAGIGARSSA